jgi:transcriptional regulator with XRE-family HTH domain
LILKFKTKAAAARVAGVTAEQLRTYERGQAKVPFEVVLRLAEVMGASLDELAGRPRAAAVNEDLLATVIRVVEERKLDLPAEKKAALISTIYAMILDEEDSEGSADDSVKSAVDRLSRLVV